MITDAERTRSRARMGAPVSIFFVRLGLFTVSWDRFASVRIGTFSLKLSLVAFGLAFLASSLDGSVRHQDRRQPSIVLRWVGATFVAFLMAAAFAGDKRAASLQALAVFLGAVVPALAIYASVRTRAQLDQALSALIRGGGFASVFGLYQLAAFYIGLPQLVSYSAKAAGFGRISAFSYEAGYFGYFIVLTIAALFSRAALRDEVVKRRHLAGFLAVLLLANTRAALLTVPVLAVLMLLRWPKGKRRPRVWPAAIVGVYLLTLLAFAFPGAAASATGWAGSIFNLSEKSSNAPRLATLAVALEIVHDHPYVGVGPGNFASALQDYGRRVDPAAGTNEVVVNNVWLQALVDGGPLLALAELGLVIAAARQLYRRRNPVARALMSGWISVILVASLITSYFFDVKLWVVLGLALAASACDSNESVKCRV